MRRLLVILLFSLVLLSACASSEEPKPFPPPEGYSSWEEYHEELGKKATTSSIQVTPSVPEPAPTPASVSPTSSIAEGWVKLKIEGIGSIDYPTDFLELQSGNYQHVIEKAFQVWELPQTDFTLQQVGLNELKPSALEEYRRVLFKTEFLNPGEEAFKANEKYVMSRLELAVIQDEWASQLQQGYEKLKSAGLGENKIVDSGSLELAELNGMFPLVWTYKRQLNDNPVVLVKHYVFWNYDRIHILDFSCRIVDEEECMDNYDKILDSFRLE